MDNKSNLEIQSFSGSHEQLEGLANLSSGGINGNSQAWDDYQEVDVIAMGCRGKTQKSSTPFEIISRSSISIGENLPCYDSYAQVQSLTTTNQSEI